MLKRGLQAIQHCDTQKESKNSPAIAERKFRLGQIRSKKVKSYKPKHLTPWIALFFNIHFDFACFQLNFKNVDFLILSQIIACFDNFPSRLILISILKCHRKWERSAPFGEF